VVVENGGTVRKFAELPYTINDKKMYPRERGFWQYKVYADIRGGSLGRGRQMRVWSLKMAIFASFVDCLPNMFIHGHTTAAFHVMRLLMTLAVFQGLYTISHQISQERCVTAKITIID